MKCWQKSIIALFISIVAGFSLVQYIVYPVLFHYQRFEQMIARFPYTKETLIIFLVLTFWLFYLQYFYHHFSVIYFYVVFSVYLFLLFVVLFTKAPKYHTVDWNLFSFLVADEKVMIDAVLNTIYFIPLGVLYGFKARWWEFLITALLTLVGIEVLQYVFYVGTFALSDILLNMVGCMIGYVMCINVRKTI